jgi:hypothetical protein
MYVMEIPKGDQDQVIKYTTERHSLQFQGTVNTLPCRILLDNGAIGTAFIDRQHCVKEGIVLGPAPALQLIVMADGSKTRCTNMATIKLRLGRYKCKVECLVIDHLEDYPLVLGNPWLNKHSADISYQRKQVILRKPGPDGRTDPHGQHYIINSISRIIINTFVDRAKKPLEPELCVMQEVLLDSIPTKQTELLSTKQVAKLVKRDQLDDAFLMLINEDTSIQEVSSSDDPILAKVPGHSIPELKLKVILDHHKDLFRSALPDVNMLSNTWSVIPLVPHAHVPSRPMFSYSPAELAEITSQVNELLQAWLIQKSTSLFGAPVLFVKKKTGEYRMCVDYRALNKVAIPNRHPLPRIDDLLDIMQGAKVFSSLDLLLAYHQIRLVDDDVVKTALTTPFGLFEYKVMPFGLTNAPSVSMAAMNDVLQGLSFVSVYLDDILIFSKTPEEHVSHVETVMNRIKEHGFFLKLSKCDFFQTSITYQGHLINCDGIMPDPKKLSAVKYWPTPKNILDVKSFLGLANYFRRYVHDSSKIAVP